MSVQIRLYDKSSSPGATLGRTQSLPGGRAAYIRNIGDTRAVYSAWRRRNGVALRMHALTSDKKAAAGAFAHRRPAASD